MVPRARATPDNAHVPGLSLDRSARLSQKRSRADACGLAYANGARNWGTKRNTSLGNPILCIPRRFPRGLFASHFLHGRQPSVVLSSVVEFDPVPLQPRDRATVFFQGCLTEYRIVTATIKRYA